MNIKLLLYVFAVPLVIWAIDGLNLNSLFKKGRIVQARIFYVILTFCLAYLLVNFLTDFVAVSKIY